MKKIKFVLMTTIAFGSILLAECSVESQKEAKNIYKKAIEAKTPSEQIQYLTSSLQKCYSPEIQIQVYLLEGDAAYADGKFKLAKNQYNKMLGIIDQVKDSKTRKKLHLLSYSCLRDCYKSMGESDLAQIMQQKYDAKENQSETNSPSDIVLSSKIVKELRLPTDKGAFKGVVVTQKITLHVNYKFDSTAFSEKGVAQAKELAAALEELQIDYAGAKVKIVGYTDTKGKADYNLKLSQARAKALVKYLTLNYDLKKLGFESIGKGESEPICKQGVPVSRNGEYRCSLEEDNKQSRRVEIIFGY